jgi:hypothetical protein
MNPIAHPMIKITAIMYNILLIMKMVYRVMNDILKDGQLNRAATPYRIASETMIRPIKGRSAFSM